MTDKFNKIEDISFVCVAFFVGTWLVFGNIWSLLYTFFQFQMPIGLRLFSGLVYLAAAVPVVYFFFRAIVSLKTKLKWIVTTQVLIYFFYIFAPPRNADAMRVWLAKIYDVWMHGEKILRPYFHYNIPDAFTFFHLPFVSIADGQVFQLSIWVGLCAILLILIKIGRQYLSDRAIVVVLCLFIFNPLMILASTVIITDVPMVLAVAGLLYSMIRYSRHSQERSYACIILFLAFGMNTKYNMLMFLPALFYWFATVVKKDGINLKHWPLVLGFGCLAALPYVMNYINIGNPVWPVMTDFFPAHTPYWDEMAANASIGHLGGQNNLLSFIRSFAGLFTIPHHINPLTVCTVFFVFTRFKHLGFFPAVATVSYFLLLWVMMPNFSVDEKERYLFYLYPVIIPLGVSKIYDLASFFKQSKLFKKLFETAVLVTVFVYFSFTLVYSKDLLKYYVTQDRSYWHRATWYYSDYEWINKNIELKPGANILVITSAQQTYYLKKPYVNADFQSAAVNWCHLTDLRRINEVLNQHRIDYIFVDLEVLQNEKCAQQALERLEQAGELEIIRMSKSRLYTSRMKNTFKETDTALYQRQIQTIK